MRPILFAVVLLVALVLVAAPATPQVRGNFGAGLPASPATDVDRTQTTLAPGVSLERFTRVTGSDRTRISVLRADLSLPMVSAEGAQRHRHFLRRGRAARATRAQP